MGKPGEYQRRVERRRLWQQIYIIAFFVVLILAGIYNIILSLLFQDHVESDKLKTYTGEFEYRVALLGRHSTTRGRVFLLNNGDRIRVRTKYLPNDDEMEQYDELVFRYYSGMPTLIGNYLVASITTLDGETVLISKEDTLEHSNSSLQNMKVFLIITLVLVVLYLCVVISFRLALYRRPHKRLKNKKN